MTPLEERTQILEENPRLRSCYRWKLVCNDCVLDAEAKLANYKELKYYMEVYYDKGYPFLVYMIESLLQNIDKLGYKHQDKIAADFAWMAKRIMEEEKKVSNG